MNITFRQGSEQLSKKLMDRAQAKLLGLSRFITERDYEAYVYVDVERESGANNSDSSWRSSINLDLAGERFNALRTADTPDKATELAIKELQRELKKAKGKRMSMVKRGNELLKRLRRSAPDA